MTQDAFEEFRSLVLRDRTLQAKLRAVTDREAFLRQVVDVGAEQGYLFSSEAVSLAMQANRRAWIERWIR